MTTPPSASGSRRSQLFIFAILLITVYVLHFPLLRLPYFWDEAGYYIPAARDLLLTGSVIPHSSPSNAHPPLVMAYLAACWKLFGFSVFVTRSAMLTIAAFTLLGVYRLALRVANPPIAIASTLCTGLYPVFFAQSSLAQVDLAAAGFTFWALEAYVDERPAATAIWFSLAVLSKETAILAPLALIGWHFVGPWLTSRVESRTLSSSESSHSSKTTDGAAGVPSASSGQAPARRTRPPEDNAHDSTNPARFKILPALLVPVAVLAIWFLYHYLRTGYIFGNPEFFRYNVQATLSPMRIGLAFLTRLWQVLVYMHLAVLTLLMIWAMFHPPLCNGTERPRIPIPIQLAFGMVILAYVVCMSVIGGAVLARYMLPVVPLVIILAVSTLWRRIRTWPLLIALTAGAFVAAWFLNPPYGFAPEDNLAYRDYIVMHRHAAWFLAQHYENGPVLTAWPASDELSRPYLDYVNKPIPVVRVEDFSAEEMLAAAQGRVDFPAALVFSTKYEPRRSPFERWQWWQSAKRRFFGFHQDLPPAVAAQILGGHIVFEEHRRGQWVAVIEIDRAFDAQRRDQDAIRWQECVLTTSHTSRPALR